MKKLTKWLLVIAAVAAAGGYLAYKRYPPREFTSKYHEAEGADTSAALDFCEKMRELGKECIVGTEGFDSIVAE